jgi:hypothetical protein
VSRCRASAADEPLAGTAPEAQAWLAVEDSGPWGQEVSVGIDLPLGVRALLIRRSPLRQALRNVFLAVPAAQLLAHWQIRDLAELGELDFAGIIAGRVSAPQSNRHLTLVCTNGKRDQCCAIDGRALINHLAGVPDVWECSHIGGHRFAPVVLHLPDGHVYGRVSADEGRLIASGLVPPEALRGLSHHPKNFQAGAVALRRAVSGLGPYDVLSVTEDPDGAILASTDTGTWRVVLCEVPVARIESCGSDPIATMGWQVEAVAQVQ